MTIYLALMTDFLSYTHKYLKPVTIQLAVIMAEAFGLFVTAYLVSYYSFADFITCGQLYGPVSGLAVAIFGNKSMWRMQADVLSSLDDIDALEFRKIIQDESAMVGISVGVADKTTTLRRITII